MPQEKTITVYKYSELTGEAKDRAQQTLVEWITDHEWYESILEWYAEQLQGFGLDTIPQDISFRGFWSQGDGLSFVGQVVSLEKLLPELASNHRYQWLALAMDYLTITFDRISSHYSHENTVSVNIHDYFGGVKEDSPLWDTLKELENDIDSWRASKCKEFYRMLEKEYDELTSEDSILEFTDCNEYQFDATGRII